MNKSMQRIAGSRKTACQKTARITIGALSLVTCFSSAQQLDGAGQESQRSMIPNMSCNGEVATPSKIVLPIGKSTLLRLPEAATNRSLGNPSVAQAMLVSPETLYLLGVAVGSTNMIIQGKSGSCSVIDVTVSMDPAGLMDLLRELMPEEKDIKVTAAADSLVLSGTASDSIAVSRAYDLALAFVRRPAILSSGAQQEGMENQLAISSARQLQTNIQQQQLRVINLLTVTAAQQVMLEVKVAEVSKTLIDKLGARFGGSPSNGMWTYRLLTDFLTGTLGGTIGVSRASGTNITLEAEKRDGLVKVLAEPNVMAISGQEGSFLAGGKILIPVAQSNVGGVPTITLSEKEFGVGLRFTPTVLSGGRINLQVAPEVSELSRDGVGINNFGNTSSQIFPLITTRRASTTVQLSDGQSFAIGGLIKNNTVSNIKAFPILGEIPILGALFRSTDFQNEKTELVFVVTPRLVKPLPPNYSLPTDNYRDPTRKELFLGGKLEGEPPQKDGGANGKTDSDASGFEMK